MFGTPTVAELEGEVSPAGAPTVIAAPDGTVDDQTEAPKV